MAPTQLLRMQFSVRAFLLAMISFQGMGSGAVARCRFKDQEIARKKEQVLVRLRELGAFVAFDYQWTEEKAWISNAKLRGDP